MRASLRNICWLMSLFVTIAVLGRGIDVVSRDSDYSSKNPVAKGNQTRPSSFTICGLQTGISKLDVQALIGKPFMVDVDLDGIALEIFADPKETNEITELYFSKTDTLFRVEGKRLEKFGATLISSGATEREMLSKLGKPFKEGTYEGKSKKLSTATYLEKDIIITILFNVKDDRIQSFIIQPKS